MSSSIEIPLISTEIFGIFRYFLKISPFNCSGPLKFLTIPFSLATFFGMLFRVYWMFYRTGTDVISQGWAERNVFAFITIESFSCLIAIARMTSKNSLQRFEENLTLLKALRKNPIHSEHDDYSKLRRRSFLQIFPIFIFFILTSVYLMANKMVIYGTTKESTWYFYFDAGISFFCAYVNFLFLPCHILMQTGMAREFEIFNEELQKASDNKELVNPQILQSFGDRQLKLFEFTNTMTERLSKFMHYAPFAMLTALANITFLVFNSTGIDLLYYLCLVSLFFCVTVIASSILFPPALIQEEMLKASSILMNDKCLSTSNDPLIGLNYRLIVDRSEKNRKMHNVIHVFSVTRKNIERSYFVISNIVLAMVVFHNLLYKN